MELTVNLIASSAALCQLDHHLVITEDIVAREGYCLAVRTLTTNEKYSRLEASDGTFHEVEAGTVLVGALGSRAALKGFRGHTPSSISVGDTLHLLNMGGILGVCTAGHPAYGHPVEVEVLGAVIDPKHTSHANIQQYGLTPVLSLPHSAPIITICGTAMDTGKTLASAALITGLTDAGFRVAAAKLTGAALRRDVRAMQEHGAVEVGTFSECGLLSSTGRNIVPYAKAVLTKLNLSNPDVIVIELGDGFIGPYGVDEFLLDRELGAFTGATVVTATDLAGAWAAVRLFAERYRRPIAAMTGPVTDNAVGSDYIADSLGIRAHNALQDPAGLVGAALASLTAKQQLMAAKQQRVA